MPASSPAFTFVRRATTVPCSVKLSRNTCSTTRSSVSDRRERRFEARRNLVGGETVLAHHVFRVLAEHRRAAARIGWRRAHPERRPPRFHPAKRRMRDL